MCLQMGYCEQCDCLPVCGEKPAVKIRREMTVSQGPLVLTLAEKIFIIEALENIQPCVSIFLEAQAGIPDAGVMGIPL